MEAGVLAACALLVLFTLNRLGVERITPYVLLGVALWVFVPTLFVPGYRLE